VFVPGVKAADDYSRFIGCGVAFVAYFLISRKMGVTDTTKLDNAPGFVVTGQGNWRING